ncbi:unnamed protein product [Prorocentrum cordatum]|uniref:Uncharacterized protein n=1 Tax=Prorocentrum cordatum TaxID=2364126 RepID=A0ABN9VE96_9DINO|nr:unnamed protein product [Polarella glacialis]
MFHSPRPAAEAVAERLGLGEVEIVGLVEYPFSGITWLRFLLAAAAGLPTCAIYSERGISCSVPTVDPNSFCPCTEEDLEQLSPRGLPLGKDNWLNVTLPGPGPVEYVPGTRVRAWVSPVPPPLLMMTASVREPALQVDFTNRCRSKWEEALQICLLTKLRWTSKLLLTLRQILCDTGRNLPVVPAEGPVSLKAAVASIMADTFFCATSRELDKVTLEIRRIVSAAKSWPEYLWLVYIGRKTYSLDAVCALLEGPHRLKYDRGYTIDPDALDHLLDNTSLGDGILHGESKIELRMRIIAVRDLLHSLPRGFLDGAPDDLAQTARVLLKTSEKKPGTPVTFSMTETAARQWPSMTTTDRLWHFFMSIGGTSHFHAWQMCLDCPDVICDASQMRTVGPSCYSYLRLAYPAVEFPATWSSAQGQDLGVRLIDHLRTRPELQGLEFPGPTLSFNNTVVPAEGPVSLKAAVASIMADTFFCATSRELDKVTLEIRRIVSAAKSWPEYLWLVYIGRKTYSLDAVCALLEGPHRLKYDRGYTIDPDALDHLLDNTSLGDGILHGESKIELRMRIIAVRDLLHSLPRGFLDGAPDDLAQTARVLLKTSEKKPGTPVTFSMTETAARQWPSMTTTDRLWHFFMSIGGTSHFHAWQMCLDCPDVICDASQMRAVGPSCYSYLRLAYPAVEFPATWSSAQGQDLGVRLIDHLRTRPELQGLEFPGPTLSFNNTEHWTCESVKATKALHNDGLLIRVGEIRHVLQGGALAVPASGKFRTRRFRTGLAAPDPSSMSGSLMYAPRTTSHAPLMKKSVVGEPPAKRQASLLAFGAARGACRHLGGSEGCRVMAAAGGAVIVSSSAPTTPDSEAHAARLHHDELVAWGEQTCQIDIASKKAELDAERIWATDDAFLAQMKDGTVVAGGSDRNGADIQIVKRELESHGIQRVWGTCRAFLAALNNGTFVAWGDPEYGANISAVYWELKEKGVLDVWTTGAAFLAVLANGQVVAWGNEAYGADISGVRAELERKGVERVWSTRGAFLAQTKTREVVAWGHQTLGEPIAERGHLAGRELVRRVPGGLGGRQVVGLGRQAPLAGQPGCGCGRRPPRGGGARGPGPGSRA